MDDNDIPFDEFGWEFDEDLEVYDYKNSECYDCPYFNSSDDESKEFGTCKVWGNFINLYDNHFCINVLQDGYIINHKFFMSRYRLI